MDNTESSTASDRRQATVLFADISGFTALSQRMDPEDMAATMDACFRVLERIIVERGGTIDKFIGDCVMALFGAPRALEHAPRQAINAAIEIRNALVRFNAERRLPTPLATHIGINTGLVVAGNIGGEIRRDYTVMGPTVNLAARLEGQAVNGQIFVGPSTYRYARNDFEFRPTKPLNLKGIDEPVTAYDVLSTNEHRHDTRAVDRTEEDLASPMVGRSAQLAVLREALARLEEGSGGVVTIEGESGLGKSRLIAETARLPGFAKVRALEGRCLATGRTMSFHPFVDLLDAWAGVSENAGETETVRLLEAALREALGDETEDIYPYLARLMGFAPGGVYDERLEDISGEALETNIHRAMRAFLEGLARERPLVLILDDLHWADSSSLELLEWILPSTEDTALLVIIATRPDEEETTGRISAWLNAHPELKHEAVPLRPLDDHAARKMVRNLFDSAEFPQAIAQLIRNKSAGNPLYIEEVVRELLDAGAVERQGGHLVATDELPHVEIHGTIEEVIMARVERLAASSRTVLQMAAVIGKRFHRRVLATLVPDSIDLDAELELLDRRHFVGHDDGAEAVGRRKRILAGDDLWFFENPLTQEMLYETLLKKTRRDLHRRIAETLERVFADRIHDFYGILSYHWTHADNLEAAEDYLVKAAEAAAGAAASAEALEFFREAYRLYLVLHADGGDPERKAIFERQIALALLHTGQLSESIEHFNSALRLLGENVPETDAGMRRRFAADLPAVLVRLYTNRLGRSAVRGNEKDHELFELMYNRCRAQNIVDAERSFYDNIAAIRHVAHLDVTKIENAVGILASAGSFFAFAGLGFGTSRRFLNIASNLAVDARDDDRFQFETMNFVLRWHEGDWDPSQDIGDALFEEGLRHGLLWNADVYLGLLCERQIRQGAFQEAEATIARLADLCDEWGYDFARSNEYAMRAFLLLERRDLPAARDAVERYHDFRYEDTLHLLALSARGKIETLLGDLDLAASSFEQAQAIIARSGRMPPFYLSAYRTGRLRLAVAMLEAEGPNPPRSAVRRARKEMRTALTISKQIARERTEDLRLAARLCWLSGAKSQAESLWSDALKTGQQMQAAPELARVYRDIGASLYETPRAREVLGESAGHWLQRAESSFADLGAAWELERLPDAAR